MAKKFEISTKRVAINKTNAQMVGIVAAAAFISVFCLIAAKDVLSQNQYQSKVTSAKEKAHRQLVQNIAAYEDLRKSYEKFDKANPNVIGGDRTGTDDKSGSNSQLVLDALPNSYDFPALASSLEKILGDNNIKSGSISGTDDQLAQQANLTSPTPAPVEMPFALSVSDASYSSVQDFIKFLEHSIRPIQIDSISMSGSSGSMTLSLQSHTYYQPSKSLNIQKQVQK